MCVHFSSIKKSSPEVSRKIFWVSINKNFLNEVPFFRKKTGFSLSSSEKANIKKLPFVSHALTNEENSNSIFT